MNRQLRKGIEHFLLVLGLAIVCFSSLKASAIQSSDHLVSGQVKDGETGEPLPGVAITVKGFPSLGTVSDFDGHYSLLIPDPQGTLIVSFTGFTAQEVEVWGRNTIDIMLAPGVATLSQVVVVGYTVQQKKDLTGAVSSLSAADLNPGAITNPLQQVAGRAAGVNVTQIGSEPGTGPSVRIRGITSLLGGSDPLVVVDGIQGNMDLLNQVPPSEIESIDILKDASATAIYGSRGAPGVIIVTTKKTAKGKVHVEYNGVISVDRLANQLDILNAEEWRHQADLWNLPVATDHGSNTDWYDLLTQTGSTNNHTLSIGGNSENFNYRASATAILQQGVVINSSNNNYIAQIQGTQKALKDKLEISFSLHNGIRKNIGSPANVGRASFRSNLITNAYVSKPTDPVLFEDGTYYTDENVFQYINPYAVAQTIINESETHYQISSLRTDLKVLEGVTLGWFGSWRKVDQNTGYYAPSASTLPLAVESEGVAQVNTNLTDEKLMDVSLKYAKVFDRHVISAVGVYEWQAQTYQGHFAQAKGFINDITTYNALQLGSIDRVLPGDVTSYKNDRKLISFLGQLNYTFSEKYLLTASIRRDGSSVFGSDHKWGTFPSIAVAWRLGDESFMDGLSFIYGLKLRVGYGVTGNQQGLYPQQSLQLVGASGTTFFNGGLITNFAVTQNSNSDLRWETRNQINIGLDFGLFEGKLNGTIDVYSATTENLLFNYTVPQPPFPYGSIVANVGSLRNEGLEISLDWRAIQKKDFSLSLAGNASFLQNKVLELSGSINGVQLNTDYVDWGYNSFLIKGQPIGTYNILANDGKEESTNEEKVLDRNADGIIDQGASSPDRYLAGSSLPTYTYAFIPTLKYKNFDLSMVWRGSGGNKIYNDIKRNFSYYENLGKSNLLVSAENLGLFTSKYGSDLWLEDGDFLRFENLSIGYTIPHDKLKEINSIRISLTGTNLALFTNYTGLDPELNVSGGSGSGADAGIYPRTQSVALGLNVTF